jgi:hypothetical protein
MMESFVVGELANCPPGNAEAKDATFFRACDNDPPTEEDFTSHVQSRLPRKRKKAKPDICEHWGLSGWISHEDAVHAQQIFDWLKSKYIFRANIQSSEGRVMQTGKPPHHTFWPCNGVDLLGRAEIALPPVNEER